MIPNSLRCVHFSCPRSWPQPGDRVVKVNPVLVSDYQCNRLLIFYHSLPTRNPVDELLVINRLPTDILSYVAAGSVLLIAS